MQDISHAERLGATPELTAVGRARVHLDQGRPESAQSELQLFPESCSPELHIIHAQALERLGNSRQALEAMNRAIGLNADLGPEIHLERARLLLALDPPEKQEALAGLEEALARRGPIPALSFLASDIACDLGKHELALNLLDRLLPFFQRQEEILVRRGDIFEKAGRRLEAQAAYTEALARLESAPASPASNRLGDRIREALKVPGFNDGAWPSVLPFRNLLQQGTNVLAVEVHQASATSSDLVFDAELITSSVAVHLVRGPYLQRGTPSSLVIRWRTDVPTASRVLYGDAQGNLTETVDDPTQTTEHEVLLQSLVPGMEYAYAVGTPDTLLAGNTAEYTFKTFPSPGARVPIRAWIIGDSGTADANAGAVRDAYETYADQEPTDLWLMLGDNAYGTGTDAEYQAAVFDMYPEMLSKVALWPTRGNHDGIHAGPANDYYDLFTLPTQGEAGGFPPARKLITHSILETPTSSAWIRRAPTALREEPC